MTVVEQLGALGTTVEPHAPCPKGQTRYQPFGVCEPCKMGDYTCAGVTPPWMDTNPRSGNAAQSMTAALPADWTRFALGLAAGAAAIFILWRLEKRR